MKLLIKILISSLIASSAHATKEDIKRQIEVTSRSQGWDPALLLSIAEVESTFRPQAVGKLGEIGLFQLRPEFHPVVKGQSVKRQTELAIRYLNELKAACGKKFLQCWNMGPRKALAKNYKHTRYEGKIADAYKNHKDRGDFSSLASHTLTRKKTEQNVCKR